MADSKRNSGGKTTALLATCVLAAAAGSLSACGGAAGGSSGGVQLMPPPAVSPPPPPNVPVIPPTIVAAPLITNSPLDDAEYRFNLAARRMNPIALYDAGFTGAGVTVAIIDTGLDSDHPEFNGRIHAASQDVTVGPGSNIDHPFGDVHGTWVTGAALAARDGVDFQGVAFNSSILALNVLAENGAGGRGCDFFRCEIRDGSIASAINIALDEGAKVINISVPGIEEPPASLVSAFERASAEGALIVIAAGNQGAAQPLQTALSAASIMREGGGIIVAGAASADNSLAQFYWGDYSNSAGSAHDVTLMAQGVNVRTTDNGGGYIYRDGTSLAAPLIAGAAALLFEAFPNLTGKEVAEILFATATDLGQSGVDSTFGHGLINLSSALMPIGTTSFLVPSGKIYDVGQSYFYSSPAIGDALQKSDILSNLMFVDSYNRSYSLDARDHFIAGKGDAVLLSARLRSNHSIRGAGQRLAGGTSFSVSIVNHAFDGGYDLSSLPTYHQSTQRHELAQFSLGGKFTDRVEYSLSYGLSPLESASTFIPSRSIYLSTAFFSRPLSYRTESISSLLNYRVSDKTDIAVGFGILSHPLPSFGMSDSSNIKDSQQIYAAMNYGGERIDLHFGVGLQNDNDNLLGSGGSGAFSFQGSPTMAIANIELVAHISPAMQLFTFYNGNFIFNESGQYTFLSGNSDIRVSAFGIGFKRLGVFSPTDEVTFAISQPKRIDSGHLTFSIPTSRDYAKNAIAYSQYDVSLVPSGRQIDVEVTYKISLETISLKGNILAQSNHGHDRNSALGLAALMQLEILF